MRIETFTLGPLQTNCYLITEDTGKRAFVVDPGMGPKRLIERIRERGLTIEAIVLTHAHFDHMAGVEDMRQAFGCPVYLHDEEADWLEDARKNGSARWSDVTAPLTTAPAEFALSDGQKLELIGHTFQVMHTPGHSPGSVSLLCDGHLISGDVLFKLSIGRTDLPGGKERDLFDSIRMKLYKLDPAVRVYPGHGPQTTIGFEMANNPYVPA